MKKLMIEDIFNNNTINIFTDASVKETNGYYVSCPGAVVTNVFNGKSFICDQQAYLSYDSSNNSGEIQAVRLGIYFAKLYRNKKPIINLFSDSNTCISGLTEWIDSWIYRKNKQGLFVNSSNKEVANQDVFKNIIDDIISNNLTINLYHQKGHVNINNYKEVQHAIEVFKKINNIIPSTQLIKEISKYNDYVDKMTKNFITTNLDETKIGKKTKTIVYRDYYNNIEGLKIYKNNINFGRK